MILPYHYQLQGAFVSVFRASQANTCGLCDIRDLTQVADEMKFHAFMTAVAARTSRPVVYEELAKEAGISAPTAK